MVKVKYVIAVAFVIGFLVSLFEFLCTGQVYLPTIVYILSVPSLSSQALFYLILYNALFVTPIVLIFVFAYFGTTAHQFQQILVREAALIKILTAILFIVLASYMGIISLQMYGIL